MPAFTGPNKFASFLFSYSFDPAYPSLESEMAKMALISHSSIGQMVIDIGSSRRFFNNINSVFTFY
jgi:hypothetical protein